MTTLDTTTYVQPSVRTFIDWTPAMLRAARLQADGGTLTLAADFCERAMTDDRIMAALGTRTKGLLGLPVLFEPGVGRAKRKPVKALEVEEDWWEMAPESELALLLAWGILLGVGFARLEWREDASTGRMLPHLTVWHPRHFRWSWELRTWLVRLDGGRELPIEAGDGSWVVYTPYGATRPWAWGAWHAICLWELLKIFAIQDWARYSERHGNGITVAETPPEWSKEKRKEIARDLSDLGANTSVALPAGVTLRLLEATANTWQTFTAQIAASDLGKSIAILGQNLSTEVSGPVSTGATLHSKVLASYIRHDEATLTTCVHDQQLVWWSEFNFGAREACPWVRFDITPPEDEQRRALASKTGAEAALNLARVGVFTVNEVRAAAGLEPIDEGGDELVKVEAPGPIGPSDGAPDGDAEKQARSKAHASHEHRAASEVSDAQRFVDQLGDTYREGCAEALRPHVERVLHAVDEADSFEDVRRRVVAAYRASRASGVVAAQVTEAVELATLAGRAAVDDENV